MKFLAHHEKTKALLRQWSGSEDLIIASFYFWGAGHESQRSQLGLLKGLLYQIILQCPNLIPSVWSSRWNDGYTFDNSFDHWTLLLVAVSSRNSAFLWTDLTSMRMRTLVSITQ
jgi:hypothetical protein